MAHRIAPLLLIPLLFLSGCPDDSAEAPENAETSTETEEKKETPQADAAKEVKAKASPDGDAAVKKTEESKTEGTDKENTVPSEGECAAALESMTKFATEIGQKPPKKEEAEEFLLECANWSADAVRCLGGATEASKIIECLKPIAEIEMRRGLKKVKVAGKKATGKKIEIDRSLAPKKDDTKSGAAAQRMESFKKAVGEE